MLNVFPGARITGKGRIILRAGGEMNITESNSSGVKIKRGK